MATDVSRILRIGVDPTNARTGARVVESSLAGVDRSARRATGAVDKTEGAFTRLRRAAFSLNGALALVGLGSATLLMRNAVRASIDFETAMAGVAKTVDASAATIARMGREFQALSEAIPVSANELAGVGEAAGQLGIATESIVGFTRVMADLGVATNLTAQEAATSFARFANIMQTPQDQFDRMGATVVDLGNNLATTERELVEFATRMAGAGAVAGLTEANVLAIGAALSSVGVEAEAGGTAVQKVLIEMNTAVAQGNDNLAKFAAIAGTSASDFAEQWRTDAAGAFTDFVEGIGRAGDNAVTVLEDLGLADIRLIRSFLSLGNAGDLLRRSIALGNTAWKENTALTEEAAKFYATTGNQLKTLGNIVTNVAGEFAGRFSPAIKSGVGVATSALNALRNNIDTITDAVVSLTLAVATLAGAKGFLALRSAVLAAGGAVQFLIGTITALKVAIGPAGWLILGVTALAGAIFAWRREMRESADGTEQLNAALDRARGNVLSVAQAYRTLTLEQVIAERERVRLAQQAAQTDVNLLTRELEQKRARWVETHGTIVGNPFKELTQSVADANERLATQDGLYKELVSRELELAKAAAERRRITDAPAPTPTPIEQEVEATRDLIAEMERLAAFRAHLSDPSVTRDVTVRLPGPGLSYEGSILRRAAAEAQAARASEEVWRSAAEGIQRAFADGFSGIFTDGLSGFRALANSVADIFTGLAGQIASALVVKELGIDKLIKEIQEKGVKAALKDYKGIGGVTGGVVAGAAGFGIGMSTGDPLSGILGGAGAGFAAGGPFGALAGGVTGLVGALVSGAQKARQAERLYREALNGVAESLRDFRENALDLNEWQRRSNAIVDTVNSIFDQARAAFDAAPGSRVPIPDTDIQSRSDIDEIIARAEQIRSLPEYARERAGLGSNEALDNFIQQMQTLGALWDQNADAIERLRQAEQARFTEDLNVRLLRAQGLDAEADALALANKQERERAEAVKAGYDAGTLALLDRVQAEERAADAARTTSDAIRDVTSALNAPSGLRLSLHRWRATQPSLDTAIPPTTLPITGGNPFRHEVARSMTVTNNIYQQPGEDSEALVARIVDAMDAKDRRGGPKVINRVAGR